MTNLKQIFVFIAGLYIFDGRGYFILDKIKTAFHPKCCFRGELSGARAWCAANLNFIMSVACGRFEVRITDRATPNLPACNIKYTVNRYIFISDKIKSTIHPNCAFRGELSGIRTPDPLIKSQLLCQLS